MSKVCEECAAKLRSFQDERHDNAGRLRLIADLLLAVGDYDLLTQDALIAIGAEIKDYFDRDMVLSHFYLGANLPELYDQAFVKSELLRVKLRAGNGTGSKDRKSDE